ncbi:putative caffeine-induced death protein 1 [Triangularia setosa]|uniref:polynucleotide adenylyltransferase n=1 Tax=Triangularia setosa TaxID=2587417 RepID=A0AAN7AC65_9PEZI|nr:putative caffeine-induced death protein 1 [Podospora setosa]
MAQPPSGQAGEGLEDRLRNMIITNQGPSTEPQQGAVAETQTVVDASGQKRQKRLNQKERRQMSAQLTIPIDTRPQVLPQSGFRTHHHNQNQHQRQTSQNPQNQHNQQHRGHGHQPQGSGGGHFHGEGRAHRPHSATFRPPNQGQGVPYTQPRHQATRSYHGPMATADHMNPSAGQYPVDTSASALPSPMRPDLQSPRFRNRPPRSPGHQSLGSGFGTTGEVLAQAQYLETICNTVIANAEIDVNDIREKENFRARIEMVARDVITQFENSQAGQQWFPPDSVQLKCFGSLMSGFATKDADMDLGLLSPLSRPQPEASDSPIPRLIEKAFLDLGLGARLLSRTRVPIIKVCERPPEELRAALVKERENWEKGTEDEVDVEEVHDEVEPPPEGEEAQPLRGSEGQPSAPAIDESEASTPEQLLEFFRQDGKSLSNYYNAAKKVLRKLGGHDITHSNISAMKPEDIELLNRVCLAFVQGLAHEKVRDTLLNCKSLNRYDLLVTRMPRTLFGVLFQIEGQMLVESWDNRKVREKDDYLEERAKFTLERWKDLLNRSYAGQDPLAYQKELQNFVESLKRIPSIALMHLAQGQHEPAAAYHKRAHKLLLELGPSGTLSDGDPILSIVIRRYIDGIWNADIQQQVDEFSTTQDALTLEAVARKHKSLQLAHDYERCLQKGLYQEPAASLVKCYIALLRGNRNGLMVPLPDESAELMSTIKQLGDPAAKSPNQPRDPYRDRLEFPKSGVGVQCDINFSAHLALQNTTLLRCYSHCDPRVRPLVLFVKHWAKVRHINTPYRGTLGSYGYAIMMLHYLINVAQPFVLPNLQQLAPPPNPNMTPAEYEAAYMCKGYDVRFWRNEEEIQRLARENALTQNRDSIGQLLRGFFEYYAFNNHRTGRGFDWGRDVISLRTHGGLLTKQEKGWTGAKTVLEAKDSSNSATPTPLNTGGTPGIPPPPTPQNVNQPASQEYKEVRYRYLFAIEDPFELDHNVARTVTHNGIVRIRDEFRRAWGIIRGTAGVAEGELLEDLSVAVEKRDREDFEGLLRELHGGVGV